MSKRQWLRLYPRDWSVDPRLGSCSLAARGLWLEMLKVMGKTDGRLLVNGQAPTVQQIASLARSQAAEVTGLLAELESFGIFQRDKDDVIYCREMVMEGVATALRRSKLSDQVLRRDGSISWSRVRSAVLVRDGERCSYCGTRSGPFEVDHIHPQSRGGSDHPANLTVACAPCNRSKGDRLLGDWRP